jgi:hypothetical protein
MSRYMLSLTELLVIEVIVLVCVTVLHTVIL